jgi:hypothetical protein
LGTIFAPDKMICPFLLAWVEKKNLFARLQIDAFSLRPFVLVAKFAG